MEINQIFLKDKAFNAQNVLNLIEEFFEELIDIIEEEPILLNYIKDVQKNYNNLKIFYLEKYI